MKKCKCNDPTKDFKRRAAVAAGWTDVEARAKAVLKEIRRAYNQGKKATAEDTSDG